MNKLIILFAAASLAMSGAAPVLALESTSSVEAALEVKTSRKDINKKFQEERKEVQKKLQEERKELQKEFNEKQKDLRKELNEKQKEAREEFKGKVKDLRGELQKKRAELLGRLVQRQLTVRGELVAIGGTVAPTTLTVRVKGVWPDFHKQWESVSSSTYPSKDKLVTVNVDSKTKIVRRFGGKSSLGELAVGDAMQIVGRLSEDGSVAARVVKDDSIHVTFRVQHGIITSLDSSAKSFMMASAASSSVVFTVKTGTATKFQIPGVEKAVFADLKVENKVWVRGVINTRTKVIDANAVKVRLPEVVPVPVPTPAPTPTSTATSTS